MFRDLTAAYGITLAQLATTLGLSRATISQLGSARRNKIGDPGVLARLAILRELATSGAVPNNRDEIHTLLGLVEQTARPGSLRLPAQRAGSPSN